MSKPEKLALLVFDNKLRNKKKSVRSNSFKLVKRLVEGTNLSGRVKAVYEDELTEELRMQYKCILYLNHDAKQTLTKRHYMDALGKYVFSTYQMADVVRVPGRFPIVQEVFEKIRDLGLTIESEKVISRENAEWSVLDLPSQIEALHSAIEEGIVSVDIETRGFDPHKDPLLCVGIGYADGKTAILKGWNLMHDDQYRAAASKLFADRNIKQIYHNGKFDIKFLRHWGFDAFVGEDTMLQSYSMDERTGIHSLGYISERYMNVEEYKGKIKFETVDPNDPELLLYLAKDCMYTRECWKRQTARLENDPDSKKLYNETLLPASEALAYIEHCGFYINVPYAKKLAEEYSKARKDALSKIQFIARELGFSSRSYKEATGSASAPEVINPASPKQLAFVMYDILKMKQYKGKRTTCADAINHWMLHDLGFPAEKPGDMPYVPEEKIEAWLEDYHPAKRLLWALLEFRKKQKLLSTYIQVALDKRDHDDRIRATFKLQGTVTGRLSSAGPNLQNIPRQKDIKNLFSVPEGRTLIECDYSQAELRVLAFLSQDPVMIKTYVDDGDLHDNVAAAIFGPDFTKEQRVVAKTINFGLAYGRGAASTAEALGVTVAEAEGFMEDWFNGMPAAAKFIKDMRKAPENETTIVTPFGRTKRSGLTTHRNLNSHQNESVNFPIQSTASDCTLHSLVACHKLFTTDPFFKDVLIVNIVHDALVFDCPDEKVDRVIETVREIMETTPVKALNMNLPMKVDAEVSKTGWGSKQDWPIVPEDDGEQE